jgi:CTP:molybdopterin cytidylyltransferase MocA
MANPSPYAGIVLAAGSGKRFGGPKAPFSYEGERLVDRAVNNLRSAQLDPVIVVLGAWQGEVPHAEVVINADFDSGMGTSLAVGIAHLQKHHPQSRGAIVTLVDLPNLDSTTIELVRDHPGSLVQACFGNQIGHPVKIDSRHWGALLAELSGDVGARQFLQRNHVVHLATDDPGTISDLDVKPN